MIKNRRRGNRIIYSKNQMDEIKLPLRRVADVKGVKYTGQYN